MIEPESVSNLDGYLRSVHSAWEDWGTGVRPWFRGEPSTDEKGGKVTTSLLPTIYREKYDENSLNQFFRMRAPALGLPILPGTEEIDKWLFVARHVGLPTRLLDWSEGALIGLYFALRQRDPVVWMLNPHGLNKKTSPAVVPNEPTITWWGGPDGRNMYFANIKDAWELGTGVGATDLPVAIYPSNIHPRMSAQRSCFTVHGRRKESLASMVGPDCLRCFRVTMPVQETIRELQFLGISYSSLFPEPEGLATELEELFRGV